MDGFFSPQAGQRRRAWLDSQLEPVVNTLNYYLGPAAQPLNALGHGLAYTDAGDMVEAAGASRDLWNDPSLGNALRLTTAGAAMAIPFVGARMMMDGVDVVGDALTSGADDVRRFGADEYGGQGSSLTAAQQKAQEVLDLLKSGRADEITDDMMAAADDAYLHANYDLPMDQASKMARAREMGFMDMPLYHGTASDFPAFERSRRGATMGNQMSRQADVWAARDPEMANEFATAAARQRGELPLRGQQILPVVHRGDRPGNMGDVSQVGFLDGLEALNRAFSKDGFDTAYMANYTSPGGKTGDILAIKNANQVRSRFARFDPRLKHLANLSAGVAGVGMFNALSENDRRELEAYLNQ